MNILDPEMNLIDEEEGSLAEEDEDGEQESLDSENIQSSEHDDGTRTEMREYVEWLFYMHINCLPVKNSKFNMRQKLN